MNTSAATTQRFTPILTKTGWRIHGTIDSTKTLCGAKVDEHRGYAGPWRVDCPRCRKAIADRGLTD